MKIYSSRKDDLIAERDAYDAETQRYADIASRAETERRAAEKQTADAIEEELKSLIGNTFLQLKFNIRPNWGYSDDSRGWEVYITSDDWNKFEDNVALSWHWDVKLGDDGEIVKETGSWSGLKAATLEQLDSLQESVRVLTILNNINWPDLLDRARPETSEEGREAAKTVHQRRGERKNYDRLLADAEFEEAIESGEWIKLNGRPQTDYYRGGRGNFWAKILKMSDKFVTCVITYENSEGQLVPKSEDYPEKISKEKLLRHVVTPVETRQA